MKPNPLLVALLLAGFVSAPQARSSNCPIVDTNIYYPTLPLAYPLTSDQYAVQYKLGNGNWTNAVVYISYYGGTLASPTNSFSGYVPGTSFSFVSIPVPANTNVQLLVTKLTSGFVPSDNVSVRPRAKGVAVSLATNGTVNLSTSTPNGFAGDQFLLWWGDGTNGGAVASLAFFLDPPYVPPAGKVKTITNYMDLTNLSSFDTLVFLGTVTLGGTGDQAYLFPSNINTVFLSPGAWVQGKLRFDYGGGVQKRVYGPGVLDGSLFRYDMRDCPGEQGYYSVTFTNPPSGKVPDTFVLDGIAITDHNHATDDLQVNGTLNNVKSLGWNGLNGGFRLGDNTKVSNVFLRCADDSLMLWGTNVTVTNATIWQNYNGAPVNLGWSSNSAGDECLIDGLYVVKTDWHTPTSPNFHKPSLDGQNNAVIASLMIPSTMFGNFRPPLFRNIVIEDPPQVLLSLKIVFPECGNHGGPLETTCPIVDLTLPSVLNLNIENLCTPTSVVSNSIGFLTTSTNFTYEYPAGVTNTFTNAYTFTGSMNIGLTNVIVQLTNGTLVPLTSANAASVGMLMTSGTNVMVTYDFTPEPCLACLPQLTITEAGTNVILSWPTNFPAFALEVATNLALTSIWKTNPASPVVVGGLNVVTNPVSGKGQFYRLAQ